MTTRQRQSLRFNLTVPGLVRDELRDGKQFLVVPVVMLMEQVLFCSNCHPDGEFVSAAEIIDSLLAWDNRPVTLSHPNAEWTPENHQRLEIGRVFNTFWDGKLKAEMWLDLKALKLSERGRVAEKRFRDGEVTEVSTGYFVDRITRKGTFEGTKFAVRQTGIIPDHLAILTDEVGACSVAGGCGAPRLNSNGETSMDDETLLTKGLGVLLKILGKGGSTDDGTAANQDRGDASAAAAGDGGSGKKREGSDGSESSMDEKQKKDLVKRLLASKKVATFDEKALLAMSDEQLTSLATLAGCSCSDDGKGDGEGKKSAVDADDGKGGGEGKKKEPAANAGDGKKKEPKPAASKDGHDTIEFTAEDAKFVAELRAAGGDSVEGLVALMAAGKVEAERREALKAVLVKQLNKDEKVAMSEAVLNSMSLEALEGLDRSLNPMSYAGRGGPRIENRGGDDDMFADDPPSMFLAEADEGDDD